MTTSKPTPVIFNHSAAIDDFVSTAVLSSMPNIDIKGIVVTNADCIATPAMDTSSKVHQFLGLDKKNIPLTLSMARGWNAFPWAYRKDCITMGTIESLYPFKSHVTPPYQSGEDMIEVLLLEAMIMSEPVIVLATGPITAITKVLKKRPELIKGIKKVVWMGGAIFVKGNLYDETVSIPREIANDKAEWNAFWDPFAVSEMFQAFSGIHMFPLDITDKAKITDEFKTKLAAQAKDYNLSKFVSEAYGLVKDEPFYEMWNTLATCFLGNAANDIFADPEEISLTIEEWGNDTQGWIHQMENRNAQSVYFNLKNSDAFYDYVLQQLKANV